MYVALHPVPPAVPFVIVQLMAGLGPNWLVTVPLPVLPPTTVSVKVCTPNVAATLRSCVIENEHAPVPVHAPLHPLNVDPVPALCCKVMLVPVL